MKQAGNYNFSNWAGNSRCTSKNYYQPETEEELLEVIKSSTKIRVVGSGHSWSPICLNNETLLNFDHFNRVLHLDKEQLLVTVQPGIKLWQLNSFLDKQGLALQNLGSISEQSVAGAMSTGTHGTGINYCILGSQVQEFVLLTANGERIKVHCRNNEVLFNKALVNLGCLGVLSQLTLRVVPAFNLHDETYVAPFDATIDKLEELVNTTDHFKLWWFPHVDSVVVYKYTRTRQPVNDSPLRQWLMDEFLAVNAYRLFLKIGNINRNYRKRINRMLVTRFISPLNRIEKSYKVFNVPRPPLHRETEWGFDISHAREILRAYKHLVDTSAHRINFLQEIRFSKADNYVLSPAYGRNTLWLGAYNADNFGWNELLADFEALARKYNGRPHWGKEFTVGSAYLKQQYPEINSFNALRKELDPTGKFENDYIARIFADNA